MSESIPVRLADLGMSQTELARRANVGLASVQRVMAGKPASLNTIVAMAKAVGLELKFKPQRSVTELRYEQAKRKAQELLELTQGNAALEAQGVDKETLDELRQRTIKKLLAGPDRRLWAK